MWIEWSEKKPEKPGFYWMRIRANYWNNLGFITKLGKPEVVEIRAPLDTEIIFLGVDIHNYDLTDAVWWSEPLTPPPV